MRLVAVANRKYGTLGPKTDDAAVAYTVTATRTNFEEPVLATHLHMPADPASGSHTAPSSYFYNFNPTSLQLPDGTWAIIVRTVRL